ncbi:MAG: CBS domain-containing protein [Chloroflexi bacterium]|nr:CBS domain-containing protein [Chloroflexota bacterium]
MSYIAVRSNTTVEQIREVINERGQTMFPIVSPRDDRLVGFILKEDIDPVKDAANTTAVDVFTDAVKAGKHRVIFVHDRDPLDEALTAMQTNSLPFLPVVDPNGRYAGTVDSAGAARAFQLAAAATFPHR